MNLFSCKWNSIFVILCDFLQRSIPHTHLPVEPFPSIYGWIRSDKPGSVRPASGWSCWQQQSSLISRQRLALDKPEDWSPHRISTDMQKYISTNNYRGGMRKWRLKNQISCDQRVTSELYKGSDWNGWLKKGQKKIKIMINR